MKTKISLIATTFFILLLMSGCKRENISVFNVNFSSADKTSIVNSNGEATITGHIFSGVSLSHVSLSMEGEAEPFTTDETTAKNKNEYDFSYTVTGINDNTTIIIDVLDQIGGKYSTQYFLVKNF